MSRRLILRAVLVACLTGIQVFTTAMKNVIMSRLTISLTDEEEEIIEEKVGDDGEYESKSEFVRNCIQAHTEVEDLEQENERLRNEKRLILEQREEATEIQKYVEEERTYRNAGLKTRLKWWVWGKPSDASNQEQQTT
jgi:Arc/MetJ-type ribon-helix-helix transcriptional regulator